MTGEEVLEAIRSGAMALPSTTPEKSESKNLRKKRRKAAKKELGKQQSRDEVPGALEEQKAEPEPPELTPDEILQMVSKLPSAGYFLRFLRWGHEDAVDSEKFGYCDCPNVGLKIRPAE